MVFRIHAAKSGHASPDEFFSCATSGARIILPDHRFAKFLSLPFIPLEDKSESAVKRIIQLQRRREVHFAARNDRLQSSLVVDFAVFVEPGWRCRIGKRMRGRGQMGPLLLSSADRGFGGEKEPSMIAERRSRNTTQHPGDSAITTRIPFAPSPSDGWPLSLGEVPRTPCRVSCGRSFGWRRSRMA